MLHAGLQDGKIALRQVDVPSAGVGEVVVELAACGICGTDLEKLRGNYRTAGVLGHEPVGRIVEVGEGVHSSSVGQRVFVHHHVPCYSCEVCRKGDYTFCARFSASNIDPGGFAERFRTPRENVERGAVLPLASNVDWATGTLLEPAGCALSALRRVGFHAGDTVVIVGLGPVGLLYGALAHTLGASWVAGVEPSAKRRAVAETLGFDETVDPKDPSELAEAVRQTTRSVGVDLAVLATGAPAALGLAREHLRRGGTLNLFGLPERGGRLDWDLQELYLRGVRVVPTYATVDREISDVHALVAAGRLKLPGIVSETIPLERAAEAFEAAGRPDRSVKVAVTGPAYSAG